VDFSILRFLVSGGSGGVLERVEDSTLEESERGSFGSRTCCCGSGGGEADGEDDDNGEV